MKIQDFQDNVTCGGFDNIFANIYKPQDIESQKSRYMSAVEKFTALYPNRNDALFGKIIHRVGLLQKRITHILFVAQYLCNRACVPTRILSRVTWFTLCASTWFTCYQ